MLFRSHDSELNENFTQSTSRMIKNYYQLKLPRRIIFSEISRRMLPGTFTSESIPRRYGAKAESIRLWQVRHALCQLERENSSNSWKSSRNLHESSVPNHGRYLAERNAVIATTTIGRTRRRRRDASKETVRECRCPRQGSAKDHRSSARCSSWKKERKKKVTRHFNRASFHLSSLFIGNFRLSRRPRGKIDRHCLERRAVCRLR